MPRPQNDLPEPELPPFTDNLDEVDEDGPKVDLMDLVETGLDESVGLDDELMTELDTGVRIEEPSTLPDESGAGEIVLDIAALLDDADEKLQHSDADEPGLPGLDPSIGIEQARDLPAEEADDGMEEPLDDLVAGELPQIDSDEEGEFSFDADAFGAIDGARDEDPPPWAKERWAVEPPRVEIEPISALSVAGSSVVAAGADLFWFDAAGAAMRLAGGDGRIASAALVGKAHDAVVFATVGGVIGRRRRVGSSAEILRGWREAAGARSGDAVGIELCQVGDDHPDVLLARTSAGALLRSDDGGASFRRIDVGGRAIALPHRASPCAALIESDGSRFVVRSPDAGIHWQSFELDAVARSVAASSRPAMAATASTIALADAGRGLVLSIDGGASWDRVRGCANASALAAGVHDGRACIFAALYRESRDVSEIVVIDAVERRALRIAEIDGIEFAESADEPTEFARVAALEWDANGRRLWAAGSFGVRSLSAP